MSHDCHMTYCVLVGGCAVKMRLRRLTFITDQWTEMETLTGGLCSHLTI